MKHTIRYKESGAVSLFVVVFAMLIITVITISFLRLMMTDQRQASDNDLAQSAYDSAQAGVEDAKRALLRYQHICSTTTSPTECATLSDLLSTSECNTALVQGGIAAPEGLPSTVGEVKVQQTEGVDQVLDQAYTCVTIELETIDYVGDLAPGASRLVPLVSREPFSTVTVNWFNSEDTANETGTVTLPPLSATHPFTPQDGWGVSTPSVMRAQLIQFGGAFTMGSFDVAGSGGGVTESNTNAAFLFPTSGAGATAADFTALDTRRTDSANDPTPANATSTPHAVRCVTNFANNDYACSMSLRLPNPINGGTNRTAFLRLTPFYNATHFQVVLSNGEPPTAANMVLFKDVQPRIDSTGRANDLFRRVQSRVDLYNTNFPYPDATIDITGDFCKSFSVTDDAGVYNSSVGTCTP